MIGLFGKKISLLLLLVALCSAIIPSFVFAQAIPPGVGNTPPTTPTAGGACNFSAIANSIQQTESSGSGCNTPGPMTKYGQAAGKYQFIPSTWASMSQSCPNASMCPHASQAFYTNPICCQVQDCAMNNLLASNLNNLNNNPSCQAILGTTVNSAKYGSCTVTKSGLLAAYHLGGSNVCQKIQGGRGTISDQLGTSLIDYVCRHGGIPVPTNCTVPPNLSGVPPMGTLPQILHAVARGQIVTSSPIQPLKYWWVLGLQMMAEQFTATMIWQVQAIGMLLDAKHQLETQRIFQQKTAEAHRDYQPSEQMCTFGTFATDLAATQRSADLSKEAINQEMLQREMGTGDSMGATPVSDSLSRIKRFRDKFCNPNDNGGGLKQLCPTPAPKASQNADINYTSSIDQKLSLDVNMSDNVTSPDEEVIFALIDNLFSHNASIRINEDLMKKDKNQYHYMNYRSLVAMRGIARNSIANIIAMKSETPNLGPNGSGPYLKALMVEFGLSGTEIDQFLGQNPSYYAQMEVLTKKMYQNPNFYTSLMDKPANVKRIRAAMEAIKLMQDRDIAAAMQRREILLSMMLELRLRTQADSVYNATERVMFEQN